MREGHVGEEYRLLVDGRGRVREYNESQPCPIVTRDIL